MVLAVNNPFCLRNKGAIFSDSKCTQCGLCFATVIPVRHNGGLLRFRIPLLASYRPTTVDQELWKLILPTLIEMGRDPAVVFPVTLEPVKEFGLMS